MANKTFFFRHDYTARHDLKIKRLLKNYGGLGYGVYWYLVEMLHEDRDSTLSFTQNDIEVIAEDMSFSMFIVSADLIHQIITDMSKYGLISIKGFEITSDRVFQNKERHTSLSELRKEIGSRGAAKREQNKKNVNFDAPNYENQPIASENQPIASENQPIASENQPIASENQPIASENQPKENFASFIQPIASENQPKENFASFIQPIASENQPKSSKRIQTHPNASKSTISNTTTTILNTIKEDYSNNSSSVINNIIKKETEINFYNIDINNQKYPHDIEICLNNYLTNSFFLEAKKMHCIRMNLDPEPSLCMDKLEGWARAFNRSLINDNKILLSMAGGTDSWLSYFPNWAKKVIEKRGYINPDILFTNNDIKTPKEVEKKQSHTDANKILKEMRESGRLKV